MVPSTHASFNASQNGFILAAILADPKVTLTNLAAALKIYDGLRRPFSQAMQRCSRGTGHLNHLLRAGWEDVTAEQSAAGEYLPVDPGQSARRGLGVDSYACQHHAGSSARSGVSGAAGQLSDSACLTARVCIMSA